VSTNFFVPRLVAYTSRKDAVSLLLVVLYINLLFVELGITFRF